MRKGEKDTYDGELRREGNVGLVCKGEVKGWSYVWKSNGWVWAGCGQRAKYCVKGLEGAVIQLEGNGELKDSLCWAAGGHKVKWPQQFKSFFFSFFIRERVSWCRCSEGHCFHQTNIPSKQITEASMVIRCVAWEIFSVVFLSPS